MSRTDSALVDVESPVDSDAAMFHLSTMCCPEISLCGVVREGTVAGAYGPASEMRKVAECIVCAEIACDPFCPHCGKVGAPC
jgi:hypothetical protein